MHQYELEVEKYWVAQGGSFRLATTVDLGTRITYEKIIFCHII